MLQQSKVNIQLLNFIRDNIGLIVTHKNMKSTP